MKLLLATDGSEHSERAARFLTRFDLSADVPDRFYLELDERVKKITANMKEGEMKFAEEVLERARGALKDKFRNVAITVEYGDPSEQILRAAKEYGADIIALGSRGMRGVSGVLGSVARNVLGHADCSVLICKKAA